MRRGQPKGRVEQEEPPTESNQDEKPQNNMQENHVRKKTLVQTAVQLGLITFPLAMYVSWAYKKFFPCPRVKPVPTSKQFKLKPKRSSRTKLPGFCSVVDFMKKRYCTKETIMKPGLRGKNCRARLAQEHEQDIDPHEMLRYDVRDEGYDRGASGKCRKPFASFYEDDFREEVDAYRQEQVYTEDRYRERQRLPERKNKMMKDRGSASKQEDTRGQSPNDQTMWTEIDECSSAKVPKGLQQGRNQQTEINQIEEGKPTSGITYCEYLKRPISDNDHPDYATNSKKSGRSNKPTKKPNPSMALATYNAESQSNEACTVTTYEDDSRTSKHYLACSEFNITPEIMDSICHQYIHELKKTTAEKEENGRKDLIDRDERTKEQEMNQRDCCGKISTSDSPSTKPKRRKQHNGNTKEEDDTTNHDDGDVCNDKYMQEVMSRFKKSVESPEGTSSGEKDFKKVANARPKAYNELCGADFHSKNSDTPYVVKDYTCKSTKSRKMKEGRGDDAKETFEHRQHKFWHACNPPKGLRKGCRMSPDSVPCD